MVTAEQWYEGEENYMNFGLENGKVKRPATKTRKKNSLRAKDRARFMLYVIVLAIVCIGVVISGAYAATLKCSINSLISENDKIEKEIETLNVEIKSANNLTSIEEKAVGELGMIYPGPGEIVYVMDEPETDGRFGLLLMEQAYN